MKGTTAKDQLESEIQARRKDVQSDHMSMSIGEIESLYEKGEIDIHPKFQRILRWEPEQKSKLIESIMLRIPLPPIFVAQDKAGKWDVVDGVQRLGTILEFIGVLRNIDGTLLKPLVLTETTLLPSLAGKKFENKTDETSALTPAQRIDFRRSRLDLNIILKESDASTKYEMFERLNTGGSFASDQEVRNCVLVWIDEAFFDWMTNLSDHPSFKECVQLSERLEKEKYRLELVLRFFVFRRMDENNLSSIREIGNFLNEENRKLPIDKSFKRHENEQAMKKTFDLIAKAGGGDCFKKYSSSKKSFSGSFLISAFEAVSLGVAHNISKWDKDPKAPEKLLSLVKKMWSKKTFTDHIGIGVNARARVQKTIPFGRSFFVP